MKLVRMELFEPDRRHDPVEMADYLPEIAHQESAAPRSAPQEDGPPADIEVIRNECAWLEHTYEDRDTLPEPEWYAALGIVGRCARGDVDGRELAHEWSQGHPDYSREETDRKLDHALHASGPRTCTHIAEDLGGKGSYCGECPYRELITSPIMLGRMDLSSPAEANAGTETLGPKEPPSKPHGEALEELQALGKDPDPADIERTLARIATSLEGANPLAIETARELALRALDGKVKAPARLVDAALRVVPAAAKPSPRPSADRWADPPYRATGDGLFHLKPTKEGEVPVPLANFTARIVGELARDDGVEIRRSFEMEARLHGRDRRFEVSASRFPAMTWVAEHLGAAAVVNAGMGTRDHARAAIQYLSRDVRSRTVFTHLGWRKIGGDWCYLHAGGAIGALGTISDVAVDPPPKLRLYVLPDPPVGAKLVDAIRASLKVLEILPEQVTIPLYCGIWRSVLGLSDYSLHLVGPTGEGKSEAAALAQQHFGPGLDARHLPGSWTSTGNSLEALAFAAKDALLVVDDFAPGGTTYDVQRQHREAARLLRAKGNQSGRGRMRPDGTLQPVKDPRALVLSTGEDVPRGHSVRARLFVLEVPTGAMDWELLTECQADAQQGLHAQAMAAFLQWLAPRYGDLQPRPKTRTAELRKKATDSTTSHRRTPSIVADLTLGMEVFLEYAKDAGALQPSEAQALYLRTWDALGEAAAAQASHLQDSDPVPRFLELLRSAVVAGRAHLASAQGGEPERPGVWGWREKTIGTGDRVREEWQPQGDRVGWVQGRDLYLEPDAAFRIAQQAASLDGLAVTPRTLWKRMKERGKLASFDAKRKRNTVRRVLGGVRQEALHLSTETLMPEKPSQPSQPSLEAGENGVPGPVLWDGFLADATEPSHETVPAEPVVPGSAGPSGTVGTVGTVSQRGEGQPEEEWGDL